MWFTLRSLVLGLALPARELALKGASSSHPPCGGPPPCARLCNPQMVANQAAEGTVSVDFLAGVRRALDDRRRIDELVTQFEYSGVVRVPAEGQEYMGQGAVKRFLTTLLVDNQVRDARVDDSGTVIVSLSDDTGKPRTLLLEPVSRGAVVAGTTLISELHVKEEPVAGGLPVAPIFSNAPSALEDDRGPKWETFDGRVRQRIWQVDCATLTPLPAPPACRVRSRPTSTDEHDTCTHVCSQAQCACLTRIVPTRALSAHGSTMMRSPPATFS